MYGHKDRVYWLYMIAKNVDGLGGLMADEYFLIHMTGVRQPTEVFLKRLHDGTFNYYSADHDSIEVTLDGTCAALTGKSRVVATVYGGRKSSWRLQSDFILRKEDGR